jgi:pyruvate/2-oxoglutarate dehydrogenase complex dihydrolipoamide dehydrogenase (E3) component
MKHYDAIIIGSGQAGTPLAKKLALAGKKTALIEKRFIGGTCVNDGCTPTKAWVASAKAAYLAKQSHSLGININGYEIDINRIKDRKDKIVTSFRDGSEKGLKETENLDVIFAEASFTAPKVLTLKHTNGDTEQISGELIFINGGVKTFIPDIPGLSGVDYLTSTSILELNTIPKHLLIIGGSYIGLEFGQMFRRFGSEVTILENADRALPREDEDIAAEVIKVVEAENIGFYPRSNITGIKRTDNGLNVELTIDSQQKIIACTHILVAVGRKPQTEALNLSIAGIEQTEKGYIKVNDKLETNIPGIYALGDIKGGPAFTHISYNDYTIVYRNLMESANLSIKNRLVPYCMFTDPQLGRIGLTESEARKKGLNIKVAKLPMTSVARAIEVGDTRGIMKAIIDADTKLILGAAILGEQGGEIMTVLQMAMVGGITYEQIRYMPFAHPLYAESLNNLFMTLDK